MPNSSCSTADCVRPVHLRGLCSRCYGEDRRVANRKKSCSRDGCDQPRFHSRQLCRGHYLEGLPNCVGPECSKPATNNEYCWGHDAQIKQGRPLAKLGGVSPITGMTTPEERMEYYTDRSGDCWIWRGNLSARGYGRIKIKGKVWMAHRLSYELATGEPLPAGLVLHHICANKACVNPDHLQPATQNQNVCEMLARKMYEDTIAAQSEKIAELEARILVLEAENALLRDASELQTGVLESVN